VRGSDLNGVVELDIEADPQAAVDVTLSDAYGEVDEMRVRCAEAGAVQQIWAGFRLPRRGDTARKQGNGIDGVDIWLDLNRR